MRRLCCGLMMAFLGAAPLAAKEKIKLMYLETDEEVRAAVLINRLDTPLEVHRLGIFRVGKNLYGVVRFGVADDAGTTADRHRIGTTVAMLSDRIFGELGPLVRIDFEGVSFRETKQKKPEVLFSCSVERNSWKTIPKTGTSLDRVQMAGALYFDPRLELGQPPVVKKTPPKAKAKAKTREKTAKRESKKT